MKAVSWNVNGLRACVGKGFYDYLAENPADFICVQETKLQTGQITMQLPEGYRSFWNDAERKGYSGTAIFTPHEPLSVIYGIGVAAHDHEGRAITLEYPEFYLVNIYTPNAQQELARLPYRLEWERDLRSYLCALDAHKPVILCGDMNVAHEEIDLKNPKTNRAMQASATRNGRRFLLCWTAASLTRFGGCIRTPPVPTAGGPIAIMPGRTMPDGGSTILSCPSGGWNG